MRDNKPGDRKISDNDAFITLMRVAAEDKTVKDRLVGILKLDDFNRKSYINTYVEQMRLKGAPHDFIEAIYCLTDDDIAKKTLEILS